MKFGPIHLDDAAGTILAHAVRLEGQTFKKGRLLSEADLDLLRRAGIGELVVARLEAGDVSEDPAAARAAAGLVGPGLTVAEPFTGRVNLFAGTAGLLVLDRDAINRLNRIDETITLATLEPYAVVQPRQMVATIKVIPFAAPEAAVAAWERLATPLRLAPFVAHRVGLVQTSLPGFKASILDKTVAVTRQRLEAAGSTLMAESRCDHRSEPLAAAIDDMLKRGADLVLVAGASAIIDRRDVIPMAITEAGGEIVHFGMPVDPGNLMLVGKIGVIPVLGLPGCARSPKSNGFDWILQRLLAKLPVGPDEVMGFGVGGLLAEIPLRGLPRTGEAASQPPAAPRIAALVLAAGKSSRMGANKMLIDIDGAAMIERSVDAALASQASPVIVVVGHQGDEVRKHLAGRNVTFVENPDYAQGLSTSVKAGLTAVPDSADGILVCLGDMPTIGSRLIDRLIAAFSPVEQREIVLPMRAGKRGNPVLWGRRFLPELRELTGDTGARHLIGSHADYVVEVEAGDDGVLTDIDTPEALAAFRAQRMATT